MNGMEIVQGLIARGYTAPQAAALAGHIKQESGFDPNNYNPSEGAHGFLQWEGDRWPALQAFAKSQGKSPTDPNVQLDFIGHEMNGSESKAGQAFLGTNNVTDAANALRQYVRFGDNSGPTRTNNAVGLLAQYQNGGVMPQDTSDPADPSAVARPTEEVAPTSLAAPVGELKSDPTSSTLASLATMQGLAKQSTPQFPALQPMPIAAHPSGQSAAIAAALAKAYAGGGNVT